MKLVLLSILFCSSAAFAATSSAHFDSTTDSSANSSSSTSSSAESLMGQNSSQIKQSDIVPSETKRKDIDEEITNARLRTVSGSKHLLSVQSSFTYFGGSIQEPGAQKKPLVSPGKAIENDVKLTGRISLKYRATDHDNLNLGVGVGWLTPGYAGQKGQSEDPYFGYSRVFRSGTMQNLINLSAQKYTADSSTKMGYNYNTYLDYIGVSKLGNSRWNLGGVMLWQHNNFTKSEVPGGMENMISLVSPFVEYEFSSHVSLRTVSNVLNYYSFKSAPSTYKHDSETQSMGVGISVSRDVYLYPAVIWAWQDIRSDKTNVNLQANINL